MAVIVSNIRLPLESDERAAKEEALKRLLITDRDVTNITIVKSSPDLRHRKNVSLVYTVGIELGNKQVEEKIAASAASPSVTFRNQEQFTPRPGKGRMHGRPVIAGFGPAGMFAGLLLSRYGYSPLVVERGSNVDNRVKAVEQFWRTGCPDTETNVQFGEGGAGTFSDGKLTTRINDPLCETVLNEFVRHGAPDDIQRLAKPHIGTDKLRMIVRSIREEILSNGGEILFNTKLQSIVIKNGKVTSVLLANGGEIETDALVMAVGHSARDTFEMLLNCGVMLAPKPFSAGVRIEHLQSEVDKGLYGDLAGHPNLPKGEYQFSLRQKDRAVYTFCMCPGGTVVAAASENGGVVTNGMSEYKRDGRNANSALVVSLEAFGSSPLAGVEFQRELEQAAYKAGGGAYRAPFQTVGAFLEGKNLFHTRTVKPTYPAGVTPARLDQILPDVITTYLKTGLSAFERKMTGFKSDDALLTGVETRTSSPVRIPRDENFEAQGIRGLYPAGEGAGYAGGIMSAAVDGLRIAGAIIERYAPLL